MWLVPTAAPTAVAAASDGHRSPGDMWRMGRAMSAPSYDILLFPTVYSYVPVVSRARKVVIIHDVIAEKYPHLTLPSRGARLFWKAKTAIGRWQADAIVTVSDFSRMGIVEHFRMAPERVFVVGEASDPVFRLLDNAQLTPHLQSLGINPDGRTVIYVGGFGPHKNLEMLVAVFAKLTAHQEFSDVRLVMVGEYKKEVFHSQSDAISEQIQKHGIMDRVIFTGFLPDEELVVLLNNATVLVLPSLMEGFGLPAVEAAACGCPVIATTASPLPGLLGEGGCYIDPTQPEELAQELTRVLSSESLRQRMRQAGVAAASRLTWDAAARQMMSVVHQVAAQ
jgi:glycosyltransferase involved in cell wall biosynthesis